MLKNSQNINSTPLKGIILKDVCPLRCLGGQCKGYQSRLNDILRAAMLSIRHAPVNMGPSLMATELGGAAGPAGAERVRGLCRIGVQAQPARLCWAL